MTTIHCPPIRLAQAVTDDINAAVAAGQLTPHEFEAKFSFGSEIRRLEDLNCDDELTVDVLPHMLPKWSVRSHDTFKHEVKVKIGIRRRIESTERDDAGAIDPDSAIVPYCDLLYRILDLFALKRTLSDPPAATWNPAEEPTICIYDEGLLKQGISLGYLHLPFICHEEI